MTYFRQIIDALPETMMMPPALRQRRVEIIILPLDEVAVNGQPTPVDANGWPLGFFEATEGRWAGEPLVRESQGEYETRSELEYGWPLGFFAETFGSLPDLPERETQGEYEVREEMA